MSTIQTTVFSHQKARQLSRHSSLGNTKEEEKFEDTEDEVERLRCRLERLPRPRPDVDTVILSQHREAWLMVRQFIIGDEHTGYRDQLDTLLIDALKR